MIHISNSSIKKQIFDRAGILAYFEYFSGYPGPCLTRASKVRGARDDLDMGFITAVSAITIIVCSIFVEMVSAQSAFA